MIPYFLSFLTAYLVLWIAEKEKRIRNNRALSILCLLTAIIILSLLAAFRDSRVGVDVTVYVNKYFVTARTYNRFIEFLKVYPFEYVEGGYKFLTYIVSRFTGNVRYLYFIIEFIDCALVLSFLYENKKRLSVSFGFLVYMLMLYNTSFNAVRQVMAVCICLYSLNAARDRKLIKFIVEMIIATLIHRSAVIMCFSYPLIAILDKKSDQKKIKLIAIISVVAVAILFFINPIVSMLIRVGIIPIKFSHYVGDAFSLSRLSAFVFLIPILIIFKFYHKQFFKADKLNALMLLYAILWPIVAQLDGVSDQFGRLAFYLISPNIFLYGELPRIGSTKKKSNIMILTIAVAGFLMFYWYINFVIWQVGSTVPYVWGR